MHAKSTTTIISTLLSLALAAPAPQAATDPITRIPRSLEAASKYGVFLDSFTNGPIIWGDCLAAASSELCTTLSAGSPTSNEWVFAPTDSSTSPCQAGFYFPADSALAVPTEDECREKIFAPMERTLRDDQSMTKASSNIAAPGALAYPSSFGPGEAVDESYPRFFLGK